MLTYLTNFFKRMGVAKVKSAPMCTLELLWKVHVVCIMYINLILKHLEIVIDKYDFAISYLFYYFF